MQFTWGNSKYQPAFTPASTPESRIASFCEPAGSHALLDHEYDLSTTGGTSFEWNPGSASDLYPYESSPINLVKPLNTPTTALELSPIPVQSLNPDSCQEFEAPPSPTITDDEELVIETEHIPAELSQNRQYVIYLPLWNKLDNWICIIRNAVRGTLLPTEYSEKEFELCSINI